MDTFISYSEKTKKKQQKKLKAKIPRFHLDGDSRIFFFFLIQKTKLFRCVLFYLRIKLHGHWKSSHFAGWIINGRFPVNVKSNKVHWKLHAWISNSKSFNSCFCPFLSRLLNKSKYYQRYWVLCSKLQYWLVRHQGVNINLVNFKYIYMCYICYFFFLTFFHCIACIIPYAFSFHIICCRERGPNQTHINIISINVVSLLFWFTKFVDTMKINNYNYYWESDINESALVSYY